MERLYKDIPINSIGVVNDIHFPFQDDEALFRAIEILKKEKPDVIVINGDLVDFWEISKFNRVPHFGKMLKEELALASSFLSDLRQDHPQARIIYTEGNHEFRIKSYVINNAPALYDENFLPDFLKLNDLKIEWVGTRAGAARWVDTYINIEGIYIGHFNAVSQKSGYTVTGIMDKKGAGNFVQAHIHRAAIVWKRGIDHKQYFGVENPCLAKLDPFYDSTNNWAQGLTIIKRDENGLWRPNVIVF